MFLPTDLNSLINLLAAAINLGLSIYILAKDRKSEINQALGLMVFFVGLWIVANTLILQPQNLALALFWRRSASAATAMLVAFLFYFALVFPARKSQLSWLTKIALILPGLLVAGLAVFSPLMIKGLIIREQGSLIVSQPIYGNFYRFATIYYLTYVVTAIGILLRKYWTAAGHDRLQLFYVLFGIGSAAIVGLLTNLFLPLVGLSQYIEIGPAFTLIMAGFLVYAIIAHRLLNIEDFLTKGLLYLTLASGIVGTFTIYHLSHASFLPSFYIFIVNFALAIFVFFQNKKNPINISFSAAIFIVAIWAFSIGVFLESRELGQLILWSKVFYFVGVLIPGILLYFSVVFPTTDPKLNVLQKALLFLPGLLLLPAVLSTGAIIREFTISAAGIDAVLGPLYPYYSIYLCVFMAAAFFNLINKLRKAQPVDKPRIRYVLAALSVVGFFAVVFNLILPWLGNYRLIWLGPYSGIFLSVIISYAIVKYRLMDISIVISRTLAEILTLSVFALVFVAGVFGYKTYITSEIRPSFVVLTLLYGGLAVYLFQQIRLFFQTSADKLFLRGKYDYYKVLADLSTQVSAKLSLPSILQILYNTFENSVEIRNPRIYLPEFFSDPEKKDKHYVVYNSQGQIEQSELPIEFTDPLIDKLKTLRFPLVTAADPVNELFVPCLLEDRLIAIWALGPKISEDPFTAEDLRLMQILSNQTAMALDHARSYEKIRVDLEAAERQLERSQRLASLGTLTAGVTHEIRNPLTVIRSETDRLPKKPRDQKQLTEYRDLVIKHIDRIVDIVQRMLNMAKQKPGEKKVIYLHEIVGTTCDFFNAKNINFVKKLDSVPAIVGNQGELQEIFVNLIQNAIEAMPAGGSVTLKTYLDGDRVAVEVSDTGKGIPEELREKIFDPFFSSRHEGVGLGLSIVYRIVREHGGDISVESQEGRGTTFKILF
ncbi:MAG: histidine kinase N-terminal 7TM domain-containing protein [bacterium]